MMNNSKFYQCSNYFSFLKNPQKYKGSLPLILRSSWEIKFVSSYLDINQNIIEWTSESVIVKYISPIDGKYHRYFVDFSFKAQTNDGSIKEFWIEIKPANQCEPPKEPKKKNRGYVNAVQTYLINQAKWDTTKQICENYQKQGKPVEFVVITEKDCPWFVK